MLLFRKVNELRMKGDDVNRPATEKIAWSFVILKFIGCTHRFRIAVLQFSSCVQTCKCPWLMCHLRQQHLTFEQSVNKVSEVAGLPSFVDFEDAATVCFVWVD